MSWNELRLPTVALCGVFGLVGGSTFLAGHLLWTCSSLKVGNLECLRRPAKPMLWVGLALEVTAWLLLIVLVILY